MFITTLDPIHIADTWRRLRAMCARVASIVGSVGAFITRDAAASVALLESIFRKLILVEAARAIANTNLERRRPPSRHPEPVEGRHDARPFTLRLQLAPRATPSSRSRKRALGALPRTPSPDHLAQKFDMLRRAIETPEPHIKRLARLLLRRCSSDSDVAQRCAVAPARPHHVDALDPRLIVESIALALIAAPAFVNTS